MNGVAGVNALIRLNEFSRVTDHGESCVLRRDQRALRSPPGTALISLRPPLPPCAHARHGWLGAQFARCFRLAIGTRRYTAALLRTFFSAPPSFHSRAPIARPKPESKHHVY